METIFNQVLEMKAAADRAVGEHSATLNACGPKGNQSVEKKLTAAEARSAALAGVLALFRGPSR
jgi:hypothetical protein